MFWLSSAILLALAGAEGAVVNNTCGRKLDANVLILGGGMGGVSTANRLMALGEKSFMLFEAGERLGGRMRRMELIPNVFFAEGPAYIHGVDQQNPTNQPIYNLMQQCGGLQGMFLDGNVKIYRGTTDVTPESNRR